MRIAKIQRVGQSARILPIHVEEGDLQGKSTSFLYSFKLQAKVTRINKSLFVFWMIKLGPWYRYTAMKNIFFFVSLFFLITINGRNEAITVEHCRIKICFELHFYHLFQGFPSSDF